MNTTLAPVPVSPAVEDTLRIRGTARCRRLSRPSATPCPARLVYLSRDGVSLLLRAPVAAGVCVEVELNPGDGEPGLVRAARVLRAEGAGGLLRLVCSWAVPLAGADLRRFR